MFEQNDSYLYYKSQKYTRKHPTTPEFTATKLIR